MGVWSDATNDFDPGRDRPLEIVGLGAAAIYHQADGVSWTGPTDFYIADYRAPLTPEQSQTWVPLYLWANPDAYQLETMFLSIEPAGDAAPPADRSYWLELLSVPAGIDGAPPVGTIWDVQPGEPLTVEVPTFATYDGLGGYQFAFTVGAVPEPGGWLALLAGALWLRRR
jgi:hypothetical protein